MPARFVSAPAPATQPTKLLGEEPVDVVLKDPGITVTDELLVVK
jgi:hypothetical protein